MLSKRYMPYVGAGGAGILIAYLIISFINTPAPAVLIEYNATTVSKTIVTGPFFYWDYLKLSAGEQFNYAVNCTYCGEDTLSIKVINSVGSQLNLEFNYNIIKVINESGRLETLTTFIISTTKSSFLSEYESNDSFYFVYSIFESLLGKNLISNIAWVNLSMNLPREFLIGSVKYNVVVGEVATINGFNCRYVNVNYKDDLMYRYCLSESLGFPVLAERYLIPGLIDSSITLTGH